MDVLERLFPGLADYEARGIPTWDDPNLPWTILGDNMFGLSSQIEKLSPGGSFTFIHESAIIGDFVEIEDGCFIGKNAEIKHCAFLRKGSWICEGAVVGHSTEVKNSVLLPYSKSPHFNYVGDSILGIGANLGAGVKLSNVRHDRKEVFVTLEDDSRVNTGLKKMGALVGNGSQIGCNTVTNPGVIIYPDSMIPPNLTVNGRFMPAIMS